MESDKHVVIRCKNNDKKFMKVQNIKINDEIQFDDDEVHACDRLKACEIFNTYIVFINIKKFTRKAILKSYLEKAKWHTVTWYEPLWSLLENMRRMFICSLYYMPLR
jgi:hypothetical protein